MADVAPVQVSIGDLELVAIDPSAGVRWVAESVKGWGSPGSTLGLAQRPRAHGAWAGGAFMRPRNVGVEGLMLAASAAEAEAAIDQLIGRVSLYETVLTVTTQVGARWCNVRRSDQVIVDWLNPTTARWSFQVAAPDPRKFGTSLTASTGLPSSSGGVSFPLTFPVTFNATTVTGQVTLTNPGNETGPLLIRIDGPTVPGETLVGPVVTHVSSGLSLVFSTSLTLGVGEFITIDPEVPEVLAQGQSSRNGWVTGRGWPGFEPGVNTYSFSAVAGTPTASMQVTAIPAWQ